MANSLFEFMGSVKVKIDEATKNLDEVTEKADKTTSSMESKFKGAIAAIGAMVAVDKIIDFGKMSVEAAAEAQAMEAQFEQVFGDLQGKAKDMIDGMGKEFNMLDKRVQPVFTSLTSMFKGVGMESEKAMDVAKKATEAAADAAAFYDTSMEQAQGSITSFVKGNYEAGESVGIFANDTQMAQFAVKTGVVESTKAWKDLDEATKQATRVEYIKNMQESSGAMGQAAREGDGYANVMGNLEAAWEQFLAVVGSPILSLAIPIIQGVTDAVLGLSDIVQNIVPLYQEWTDQHPILSQFLEGLVMALGVLAAGFGIYTAATTIATAVTTAFTAVMGVLTSPITLVILAIAGLTAVVYTLYKNWETVGPMLNEVWTNISTWVVTTVSNMANSVVAWFSDMWQKVQTYVSNIYNSVSEYFSNAYNSVLKAVKDMFNAVKEWFGKIPGQIKELWNEAETFLRNINLFDIGKNIVNGLLNGIKNAWSGLTSWLDNKTRDLVNSVKGVFDINSPSRVFRDEIGRFLPMGMAEGIKGAYGYVEKAMAGMQNIVSGTEFSTPDVTVASEYAIKASQSNAEIQTNNRYMLEDVIMLLRAILEKDIDIKMNGRSVAEEVIDEINYLNDLHSNRNIRIGGGFAQ
ncbi:hypothetical protein [Globicatella sp. PHS-GS-PNBC-21-1553]|uniref:phage tail protein n=1 Tax=Globicatella sp. PHS-GS-PNBC-21-1553 TaxID=2885764 RepID=UPI00298F152E|nr:hypothetical protein [Globicatella sp. PHS-GS-PNBC-21-1553]WPC08604.1 hypothetical protein LB888_11545 [Globicatella sp. PHS-GS-PNBC-21-1553]